MKDKNVKYDNSMIGKTIRSLNNEDLRKLYSTGTGKAKAQLKREIDRRRK